jgi:hypothetical protein
MKSIFKNFALALAVFSFVFILGTCGVSQLKKETAEPIDTNMVHLMKEKVGELQKHYKNQIHSLEKSTDSLKNYFVKSQKTLTKLRTATKLSEQKLVKQLDSDTSQFVNDSIKPALINYIALQLEKDSICKESINTLQLVSTKQDSIISLKNKELLNLYDLTKFYQQREQILTEELNTAYKSQRKVLLKAKLFKGMAILLTGVSSALIINQTLK